MSETRIGIQQTDLMVKDRAALPDRIAGFYGSFPTSDASTALYRTIEKAKSGTMLNFIVPWEINVTENPSKETQAVKKIIKFRNQFSQFGIRNRITIVPFDYSADPGSLIRPFAPMYINNLREEAGNSGILVEPWSQIKRKNAENYDQSKEDLPFHVVTDIVPARVRRQRIREISQKNLNTGTIFSWQEAMQTLQEELLQTRMFDSSFKRPIVLSAGSYLADNELLGAIPQIFIMPDQLQNPWLSPKVKQKPSINR